MHRNDVVSDALSNAADPLLAASILDDIARKHPGEPLLERADELANLFAVVCTIDDRLNVLLKQRPAVLGRGRVDDCRASRLNLGVR